MDQELFQVKTRKERSWDHLCDARGSDKLHWGLRIFADGLAEDEHRVSRGDRSRLSESLAGTLPCRTGVPGQAALFSRAQEQAARVVSQIQRAGLPRVADAFLDHAVALAPRLMSHFRRWLSRERAVNALLDGWSPAGRLAGLAFPDRQGLEDLMQLLTGALYLDLDQGLGDDLRQLWPAMLEARDGEPRLFAVVAALVQDVSLAEQMRLQPRLADHPGTRLPSLLDHLLGRVRGASGRERFAAHRLNKQHRQQLALDLERITLELAGELTRNVGWPAGRALLARRMLAHCLVPRLDVCPGRVPRGVSWSDLPHEPAVCPLHLLPSPRDVLAALQTDPRLDLAGQYQGTALVVVLPRWLELLMERGLLGTRETDGIAVYLGELLASQAAQRNVWDRYYDPTVLRHLSRSWFRLSKDNERACQSVAR